MTAVADFTSIPGLQSWHSARLGTFKDTALTSLASNDGDPIAGWGDRQANANATQATTANQASRGIFARPNGQPGVKFSYTAPTVLGLGVPTAYANLNSGSWSVYGLLRFYGMSGTYSTIFTKTSGAGGPHGRIWFRLNNASPQLFGNALEDLALAPPNNSGGVIGTTPGNANQFCNRPFTFGYSFKQTSGNTGTRTWWINGAQYASGTITLNAANTTDNFTFGQQNDTNYPWNGEIAEWTVWNTALSNTQFASCDTYLQSVHGCPQIICWGDSITQGVNDTAGQEMPTMLAQMLGGSASVQNNGRSGYGLGNGLGGSNLLSLLSGDITNFWTNLATQKIVLLWAGTNDLYNGNSAATTYGFLRAVCGAIKAATPSAKIIVVGCLPRAVAPAGTVIAFNNLIRPSFTVSTSIPLTYLPNNGVNWADMFIDVYNVPEIAGVDSSTTYFVSGGTHPTGYLNQILTERYFGPAAQLMMQTKLPARRAA